MEMHSTHISNNVELLYLPSIFLFTGTFRQQTRHTREICDLVFITTGNTAVGRVTYIVCVCFIFCTYLPKK